MSAKRPKIRRQFEPDYKGHPGTKMDPESMTEPDMSLTVKQLLVNHTRGIDSGVQHNKGEYFGVEIPRFDDITEAEEYRKRLQEQAGAVKKDIEDRRAEILEARAQEIAKEKKAQQMSLEEARRVIEQHAED